MLSPNMFRCSERNIGNNNVTAVDDYNVLAKCTVGTMSKDNDEWIYKACQSAILDARISKLSIYTKMGFVQQSPELNLYPIEERLVAIRVPFMQI